MPRYSTRAPLLALMTATISACGFSPPFGDGQLQCAQGDDPCPPGYVCRADGRCYAGTSGGADGSVPRDLPTSPDSTMTGDGPGADAPDQPVVVDMPAGVDPIVDLVSEAPPVDQPPAGCTSNAQCPLPTARVCSQADGQCVGCLDETDCPADLPLCDPSLRQCATCLDDGDCPAATPFCDGRLCVECTRSDDCTGGVDCERGSCVFSCTSDAECTLPATCGGRDPGQCGCNGQDCEQLGVDCGEANDGCGRVIVCGKEC